VTEAERGARENDGWEYADVIFQIPNQVAAEEDFFTDTRRDRERGEESELMLVARKDGRDGFELLDETCSSRFAP